MAYPTDLDTTSTIPVESASTSLATNHVTNHTASQTAIIALETKLGIDSSAVATTIDYLVKNVSSSNPGHKHTLADGATDVTATAAEVNKLAGTPAGLTSTELGYVDGVTSAIQAQLDARVDTTGNETIAGVKTFSSDPLIPDEAYGVGWNGVLEPPTKNAVYDKIETIVLPSTTVMIPRPIVPYSSVGTRPLNNNVDGYLALFRVDRAITVNKLSFNVTAVGVTGTLKIGVFSADGQTQYISIETASISGAGIVTTAVSSVALAAGNYYIVFLSVSTASITVNQWTVVSGAGDLRAIASEPTLCGVYTCTASTMPATLTIASISSNAYGNTVFRLDN